ncbi:hypothetical protein DFQ26_002082, partial [Actinomortierella ambigua]
MAKRITRRSTRSEPQQQPSEDAPLDAVASSHVEVVLVSKKGRKKSVVDKRAAEPELSDEDKDDVEEPVDVALASVYMEIDEEAHAPTMQTDEEHQQQTVLDSPETSVTHAEESVEVIDRFYAHQLQEIETREELEKEEFYTSTQFEDLPEALAAAAEGEIEDEDENTVRYYPPEPEGQEEDDENSETVKYYPPSEVDDERDPRAIYGLADADLETATTSTSASCGNRSDADGEDSSSVGHQPPAFLFGSHENSPAPSFEFSPMQTPTDSPAATPGPSRLRMTEDDDDEEDEAQETEGVGPAEKHLSMKPEAHHAEETSQLTA